MLSCLIPFWGAVSLWNFPLLPLWKVSPVLRSSHLPWTLLCHYTTHWDSPIYKFTSPERRGVQKNRALSYSPPAEHQPQIKYLLKDCWMNESFRNSSPFHFSKLSFRGIRTSLYLLVPQIYGGTSWQSGLLPLKSTHCQVIPFSSSLPHPTPPSPSLGAETSY